VTAVTAVVNVARARAASVAAATLALLALLALTPSCSVSRRSTAFACSSDADCDADRVCSRGYCAERTIVAPPPSNGCPAGCTSCDLDDGTCTIKCTANRPCGRVTCPPGFSCLISCDTGACSEIDCTAGGDCEVTCDGENACPSVRCGTGACDVGCSGAGACGLLDCGRSCRCDQVCSPSATACLLSLCPIVLDGICTEEGEATAPCDSTDTRGCDRCP
jgi:hypothetical protein